MSAAALFTPIHLLVGLGNVGQHYEATRHNAGFWVADKLVENWDSSFSSEKKLKGMLAKAHIQGKTVLIFKPNTYMNCSGYAVSTVINFYKLSPQNILVLHDDLDLTPGQAKLNWGDGYTSHNGLRNVRLVLSSSNFWRLRIGIGHPRTSGSGNNIAEFVLGSPEENEKRRISSAIERFCKVFPDITKCGFASAVRKLHTGNRH